MRAEVFQRVRMHDGQRFGMCAPAARELDIVGDEFLFFLVYAKGQFAAHFDKGHCAFDVKGQGLLIHADAVERDVRFDVFANLLHQEVRRTRRRQAVVPGQCHLASRQGPGGKGDCRQHGTAAPCEEACQRRAGGKGAGADHKPGHVGLVKRKWHFVTGKAHRLRRQQHERHTQHGPRRGIERHGAWRQARDVVAGDQRQSGEYRQDVRGQLGA